MTSEEKAKKIIEIIVDCFHGSGKTVTELNELIINVIES